MTTKESTDLEREAAYLIHEIGMEPAAARRIMEDEDLWRQPPASRYAFLDAEEDVRQWETALAFADALHEGFHDSKAINEATQQALHELREIAAQACQASPGAQRRRRGGAMSAADTFVFTPTVLYCLDVERDKAIAATVPTEIGTALLVFRSEADAEAFIREAGGLLASASLKPVNLGDEEIADLLSMHGLPAVAMPEPWTGRDRVDLFSAESFIRFLEESEPLDA